MTNAPAPDAPAPDAPAPDAPAPDAPAPTRTIMYLCYGPEVYRQETTFSLLTAYRHLPPGTPGYRYLVYTDHPEAFADLGAEVRRCDEAELQAWTAGGGYIHRRKTMAVLDALRRYGGDLAFIDCDTYFRRSPALLFERIGPGRSVLHVLEARLLQSGTAFDAGISEAITSHALHDRSGRRLSFLADEPMWNSGVIGISSADLALIEEIPPLIDELWRLSGMHHVEQFATGYALKGNRLSECRDVVFHYWVDYLRDPFHARLPVLLARGAGQPLAERARRAFRDRPRAPASRWLKLRLRESMRRLGLPISGMMKSA